MSYSYEYDESGLAASYLALSFLLPFTLVYGYTILTRKTKKVFECSCCKKKKNFFTFSKSLLFILLCLVAFFTNNIRTIKMDVKKGFDPLEVLGVSLDASKKVIKRKMQTLLMKYAVSKAPENKKEEYEKKCVDISKAYVIMRNPETFKTWLNTESKSGEIMAIPDIVMKNALLALLVYCVILGLALPYYAVQKWRAMKNKNRLNVNFASVEEFLNYFNEDLRKRGGDIKSLMWILSKSVEFRSHSFKPITPLRDIVGEQFGYPLPDIKAVNEGYYLLCDHLFRTEYSYSNERSLVVKNSLPLIECMKILAFHKGYIEILKSLHTFQAMIVQAVFDEEYSILQFPYLQFKDLYVYKIENGGKLNPKEVFSSILNEKQLKIVEKLDKKIPRVTVEEFVAVVKNTGQLNEDTSDIENDDEDFIISSSTPEGRKQDVPLFNIPKDSLVTVKVQLSSTNSSLCVHSHYFDEPLEHSWTVFISIDNVLHKKFIKFNENKAKMDFEFQAPAKKSSEVKLHLYDGFYLKNNVEQTILIKYV